MKRLGIFCFYDKDGILDDYVELLLKDLNENLTDLYFVANGKLNDDGIQIVEKYTENIIIRSNVGFDAGAYAEALINNIGEEELQRYDEIVLCNDSFYGPFKSFKEIFADMEKKDVDFWGLNYHSGEILNCVHSYFLVFRKNIIKDNILTDYMNRCIDRNTEDFFEVVIEFELGLFKHLEGLGYSWGAYADTNIGDMQYLVYDNPHKCLINCGFPILKRKSFSKEYYDKERQLYTLKYLYKNNLYDVNTILKHVNRVYKVELDMEQVVNFDEYNYNTEIPLSNRHESIKRSELIEFCEKYSNIYIYGAGLIARKIWWVYAKYFSDFKGFIISNNQKKEKETLYGYDVFYLKDVQDMEAAAVIVSVNVTNAEEIRKSLGDSEKVIFIR